MEDKMSFHFMLSLKEIIMRRVAINLWNQSDILVSIECFSKVSPKCCNYSEKWRDTVENKVIDKLSKLVIPVSLFKQLLLVITPIGLQIPRWKVFHERYLGMPGSENVSTSFRLRKYLGNLKRSPLALGAPVLEKLCWTATGTIDYRQTADELIRCEMVDIEKRYRLACLYCLEDRIPLLWDELPGRVKREYYKGGKYLPSMELPYCWPFIIKGEQSKLDCLIRRRVGNHRPFNQTLLIDLASDGNKFAIEFFLRRFRGLSNEEINVSLITKQALVSLLIRHIEMDFSPRMFPLEHVGSVLCYLLSLMDYKQQVDIIQSDPINVLICFLEWPWQDIFLKIADSIWGLLSAENYDNLLYEIRYYFTNSNYSYPKFFQEFFTRSPIDFRKRFVNYECHFGEFFTVFFDIQDSETVEVVLKNIDAEDRVRLVTSENILKLICDFILKRRWHMVALCLREARLSKEDRERVEKVVFMEFLRICGRGQIEKSKPVWLRFLQILDEAGEISQSKRSSEDET